MDDSIDKEIFRERGIDASPNSPPNPSRTDRGKLNTGALSGPRTTVRVDTSPMPMEDLFARPPFKSLHLPHCRREVEEKKALILPHSLSPASSPRARPRPRLETYVTYLRVSRNTPRTPHLSPRFSNPAPSQTYLLPSPLLRGRILRTPGGAIADGVSYNLTSLSLTIEEHVTSHR